MLCRKYGRPSTLVLITILLMAALVFFFGITTHLHSNVDSSVKTNIQQVRNELSYHFHQKLESVKTIVKIDPALKPRNIKLLNQQDIQPFRGNILFLVNSNIGNKERRTSIRKNWANQTKFNQHRKKFHNVSFKAYFMTGFKAEKFNLAKTESVKYGDLLITNRTEDYWDFSRRAMISFHWTIENCYYDYLLKADDDIFIHIPNLFTFLYKDPYVLKHHDRLYAGYIIMHGKPHRNLKFKWGVTYEEWGADAYPPFSTGMGFILSRFIIEKMIPHFDWEKPFRVDDVYIGHLVYMAQISNIGIRSSVGQEFSRFNDPKKCPIQSKAIVYHQVLTEDCMRKLTESSLKVK
uniref:Hexosyltransferase n=1 Tax=Clytia hemisphaerica TaxID=252671 RepID=A0A7M5VC98_9CNID